MMEIERKFVVPAIPFGLSGYEKAEIRQGYIAHEPTIRIRQWNDSYILTVKGRSLRYGHDLRAREEFELALDRAEFDALLHKVETRMIVKTRYMIPLPDGLTAEFDIYHDFLQGLLTVEVEFDNMAAAESFIAPSWFGREVTQDKRFTNSQMSLHGIPA